MDIIKETFYVEVTDDRVDLDPPYVWQSQWFDNESEAAKLARKVAGSFGRSDLSLILSDGDFLNPDWEVSAKGVKKHLHVRIMVAQWISEEEYEIFYKTTIK